MYVPKPRCRRRQGGGEQLERNSGWQQIPTNQGPGSSASCGRGRVSSDAQAPDPSGPDCLRRDAPTNTVPCPANTKTRGCHALGTRLADSQTCTGKQSPIPDDQQARTDEVACMYLHAKLPELARPLGVPILWDGIPCHPGCEASAGKGLRECGSGRRDSVAAPHGSRAAHAYVPSARPTRPPGRALGPQGGLPPGLCDSPSPCVAPPAVVGQTVPLALQSTISSFLSRSLCSCCLPLPLPSTASTSQTFLFGSPVSIILCTKRIASICPALLPLARR